MVSLKTYHTFGLESYCDELIEISSVSQLRGIISSGYLVNKRFVVVGSGSNVLFPEHYSGVVLHIATQGVNFVQTLGDKVLVAASAGVVWDDFVRHCIDSKWYGLECLSAIPGTVGASVVQNIGAYGSEVSQYVHHVVAVDTVSGNEVCLSQADCAFGYRNSCFKHEPYSRYIVIEVVYLLSLNFMPNLSYKALGDAVEQLGATTLTAEQLADIVTTVRWSKLPRPSEMGSAGSFFKNPVVDKSQYENLKMLYPNLVAFPYQDGYKLSAGWLIEHCGWKGRSMGPCGVYSKQALVLVNLGGCTRSNVDRLVEAVVSDVSSQYGIVLEPEAILV